MAVYIVTYDLNHEVRRPKIVDAVKSYGTWAKLSESSYAIVSGSTPEQVRLHFQPLLDDNDNLFVISLRQPYAGWGGKDVHDWLSQHLPRT